MSKLGESTAKQTKAISTLLQLIKDIPMDGKQDYDVLGYIYEYLIEQFAANAGKKAGEFYTPHEVSLIMSEIIAHHLKDLEKIRIYDPTSGSGSLLINIGNSVAKHIDNEDNIEYYAQELKANTYNLTRMNLIMRGIIPENIVTRNGDTLEDDWPFFDENNPSVPYDPLYVDAVVSNPPYSQQWNPEHKDTDPRYARFGLAPKTKADYAFLLHDLYHLRPHGIMTIVLPHGVLFRGGEEAKIRKGLIDNNHIEAIIGLPANIFFGTGIPTVIIVLRQKRIENDVLIVDASKHFKKEGKNNKLQASDIKRIADTVIHRESRPGYSRLVSKQSIRDNDYNLNIPRYVDSSSASEVWDLHATMLGGIPQSEIDALSDYWQVLPDLQQTLFKKTSPQYAQLAVSTDALKQHINQHTQVHAFSKAYHQAIKGFDQHLVTQLITHWQRVNRKQKEQALSNELFTRLQPINFMDPMVLIDKYSAYQLLDNHWQTISTDLEILQSEGFSASTQVDPNIITKKKNGKDTEVQDGWLGRILPFELVQQNFLQDQLQALQAKEDRLLTIISQCEALLDALSEEDKQADTIKDSGDAFNNPAVAKQAKALKADMKTGRVFADESYESIILKADGLIIEEKALKKALKAHSEALHLKTKATIEGLNQSQVNALLEQKWITPLLHELSQLPSALITKLTNKLQTLADKYAVTYANVASDIKTTEQSLASMLDELTGNKFDQQGLAELKALLQGNG